MTNRIYAVTGATGYVGKVVVEILKAQGHQVRSISRGSGVSFDDAAALMQAFSGVDGAFLMIPFDMKAPDLHRRENEIGRNLAEAVMRKIIAALQVSVDGFIEGTHGELDWAMAEDEETWKTSGK